MCKYLEITKGEPIPFSYIEKTDENGVVSFIPKDEANSDYQTYLRWLENPNAQQGANLND